MQLLDQLMNLPLDSVKMEPCYDKVNLLQEHLQDLKSRFRFPHIDLVIQRTQNYMQEVGTVGLFEVDEGGEQRNKCSKRDRCAQVARGTEPGPLSLVIMLRENVFLS